MSEKILIKDIFDELKDENNRLLNDLINCQKFIELFEKYRNSLINITNNCKCNENTNKNLINLLENEYICFENNVRNTHKNILENNAILQKNINDIESEANVMSNNNYFQSYNKSINESISKGIKQINYKAMFDKRSKKLIKKTKTNKKIIKTVKKTDVEIKGLVKTKNTDNDYESMDKSDDEYNAMDSDKEDSDSGNDLNKSFRGINAKQILEILETGNFVTQTDGENELIKVFYVKDAEINTTNRIGFGCNFENDCKFVCPKRSTVLNHISAKHKMEKNCGCDECDYKCSTVYTLRLHKKLKHNKPYLRIKNEFKFSRRRLTKTQISNFLQNGTAISHVNEENDSLKEFFLSNTEKCSPNRIGFGCNYENCRFISAKRADVFSHIRSIHTLEKPFNCDECDYTSSTKLTLRYHKEFKHNKTGIIYKCDFSGCTFETRNRFCLNSHYQNHNTVRSYHCSWPGCEKSFTTNKNLRSHTLSHSDSRPYRCQWPGCDSCFKSSSEWRQHERIHSDQRNYKCVWPHCDARFKTNQSLRSHLITHSQERAYACSWPQCDKRFIRSAQLREHLRIHANDKPFKCLFEGCDKAFVSSTNRRKHLRTHNKNL